MTTVEFMAVNGEAVFNIDGIEINLDDAIIDCDDHLHFDDYTYSNSVEPIESTCRRGPYWNRL